jgi:hypothetical protein
MSQQNPMQMFGSDELVEQAREGAEEGAEIGALFGPFGAGFGAGWGAAYGYLGAVSESMGGINWMDMQAGRDE